MESIQKTSNPKIIILQSCRSSDSESEKNILNIKLNPASSFDSENFQDSSLEVSNFSNDKLNDNQNNSANKPKKLNLIQENGKDEQNSSIMMDRNETCSKKHLMELIKFPQRNGEKTINKISSNDIFSPISLCKNTNSQQNVYFINKKNEEKSNVNEFNELEMDGVNIRILSNQCICSSSSCKIF